MAEGGLPSDFNEAVQRFVHPNDQSRLVTEITGMVASRKTWPVEYRIVRPDGQQRTVVSYGHLSYDEQGSPVRWMGVFHDVTDAKAAEELRRCAEERFRRVIETAHEGIGLCDADGRTVFANQQLAAILGYSIEELLGRPLSDFLCRESGTERRPADGASAAPVHSRYECRFRRKDGSLGWAIVSETEERDANGQGIGAFLMVIDVTQHVENVMRVTLLERQLAHSSRLAAMGELAAGIAHELNQPLCAIANLRGPAITSAPNRTPIWRRFANGAMPSRMPPRTVVTSCAVYADLPASPGPTARPYLCGNWWTTPI